MASCNREVTSTSIHMANQARLAFLAVTHRYKRTHCLWLEQFQIADYACSDGALKSTVTASRSPRSARIAVVLGRLRLSQNLPFCARDLGPGIPDRGPCSWSWGAACARPAGPLLSAGGRADAGCRALCQVARCRPRGPP